MSGPRSEIVFVDIDDTLVRSAGTKRRSLKKEGAMLYCWSTGGAEYARDAARAPGLKDHFGAFLPKRTVNLDDQAPVAWRPCRHLRPFNVASLEAREEVR